MNQLYLTAGGSWFLRAKSVTFCPSAAPSSRMLKRTLPSPRMAPGPSTSPKAPDRLRAGLRRLLVLPVAFAGAAISAQPPAAPGTPDPPPPRAADIAIESPRGTPRPPFDFSAEDEALLDEVQRGAFGYLWNHACPQTGMVFDRSSVRVISVAGVGFQLAAIPVGVERGWVTREQGRERAERILRALVGNPSNRHAGLFFHYLDEGTAGPSTKGYETVVSTVDSALLLAGVITAGTYFGGDVARLADGIVHEADWAAFIASDEPKPHERGFISLGWKPDDAAEPGGPGKLLPYYWVDSADEHRLVTFLAVCAPEPEHRADPALYYRLRRQVGAYAGSGPIVWFPWSGALFTAFFSHCWIDYASIGPDDPAARGVERRSRVDWWENSRRLVNMHRAKARENPRGLPTFGENAWGLTACDAATGYMVPGLFPDPMPVADAVADFDYAPANVADNWGDGTIPPYGAGCSIMFEPAAGVAALRHYRSLKRDDGSPLVWRDPAVEGQYGFLDSFNLGKPGEEGKPWVARDYVAIDQGPLILAIENARTGLIWRLFHEHAAVRAGVERLGLRRDRGGGRHESAE